MNFFNGFLRGIALLPGVVQDTETLFATKTNSGEIPPSGAQKKAAAIEIVGASISMADAIGTQQIADSEKFTAGLSQIVDGVVACLNASIWAKHS